jgi:hypothetical protein
MTQKAIGPSFFDELSAHGGIVGEHFTWDSEGNLYFFDDTPKSVVDGVKAVYAAHDPGKQSWQEYRQSAQDALASSDITVMRCYENGVTLPAEWVEYRKALRLIVGAAGGDTTKAIPPKPPYPAGT